ncbi:hypothetical protein LSAT2_020232 [Lamellibrachia satsuma]|nr:hypothetical protein LSAT2_020232 [Lamellibrachia satsuma]
MADTKNAASDDETTTVTDATVTADEDGGGVDAEEKKVDDSGSGKEDVLTKLGLNTIYVYISSVSLDTELKVRQRRVLDALESKQIPYQVVDIANNRMAKRRMRHMSMDENAVPPRIFRGEIYLGKLTTTRDVSTRRCDPNVAARLRRLDSELASSGNFITRKCDVVNSTSRFLFMVPDEQHKESSSITLSLQMSPQGGTSWSDRAHVSHPDCYLSYRSSHQVVL